LRVYDPFLGPQAVFRVRVIDEATNAVLSDREYMRVRPTDPPVPTLVPDTLDFSDSLSAPAVLSAAHVTVEVARVPADSGPGFWPMISVTSNRTNHFAVFTPR
jgi:hypothetical protein